MSRRGNKPDRTLILARRQWQYPLSVERDYQRILRSVARSLNETVNSQDIFTQITQPKPDTLSEEIVKTLRAAYAATGNMEKSLQAAAAIGRRIDAYNQAERNAVLRSALQVDVFFHEPNLRRHLAEWAVENTRLIKTIPEQYFSALQGIFSRGLQEGIMTKDLKDQVRALYGVTDKRARVIARDQVSKLNGQLTQKRQTGCGIPMYIWSTSKDERVRASHAEHDGHMYFWQPYTGPPAERPICPKCGKPVHDPPAKGHPGREIQCRCVALPVVNIATLQNIAVMGEPKAKGTILSR